jgi:hypothetical protein
VLGLKKSKVKCNDSVVDFVARHYNQCEFTGDLARSRGSAAVAVLANELSKLRLVQHDLESKAKKSLEKDILEREIKTNLNRQRNLQDALVTLLKQVDIEF